MSTGDPPPICSHVYTVDHHGIPCRCMKCNGYYADHKPQMSAYTITTSREAELQAELDQCRLDATIWKDGMAQVQEENKNLKARNAKMQKALELTEACGLCNSDFHSCACSFARQTALSPISLRKKIK